MNVVGLMSGTSADGVDAVVVQIEGAPPALRWRLRAHVHTPYEPAFRREVLAAMVPEQGTVDRLCRLNVELGLAFARAAQRAIAAAGLRPEEVELIGSHGQTFWHAPAGPYPSTLQLGEAAVIAEETGITTVSNLRARDCAAGGQGAPLVAYVDWLLFSHPTQARALQNIGGIANVTFLPARDAGSAAAPLAFDTGPGNMLIDDAARRATDGHAPCDRNGAMAARGHIHEGLLAELLAHPYLHRPPPKTTGREEFGTDFSARVWERARALGLAPEDLIATVTAFTARSIALAYREHLPAMPAEVILSGGGVRNPVLVHWLQQELAPVPVRLSDDLGLPAEAKEAAAFAILAYETWHGRPGNLPEATGARHPVVLGQITPGRSWPRRGGP